MELGIQSSENPILRLHEVSASKGQCVHKHSERLLGDPGEDMVCTSTSTVQIHVVYRFKIPSLFSWQEGILFR